MEKLRLVCTAFLIALLISAAAPLLGITSASAEEESAPTATTTDDDWVYVQNNIITLMFPANGKKPMFLWWYKNDTENINVVKLKGLVEYTTYEKQYFLWRCRAEAWKIRESLKEHYYGPWKNRRNYSQGELHHLEKIFGDIDEAVGLHNPYLPFSSARWRLDGPENVTKGDVKYLSFNFTLVDVPGRMERFQFAESNVIIRCRFYYTPVTEDAYGQYTYSVDAGELKIDLIIKHWEWNIDKLEPMIQGLRDLGFDIPQGKTGLALWVNLASINLTQREIVEDDLQNAEDAALIEGASTAKAMYVEGGKVPLVGDNSENDESPMQSRWRERFQVRFEKGNSTLVGFFKFVPQAIVTDGNTYNTTDVTASYTGTGAHMRLFIGYPYFGNNTLEHDPSLGLEEVSPWLPTNLLAVLVGVTVIIAVAIAAIKIRRKPVNIIGGQ